MTSTGLPRLAFFLYSATVGEDEGDHEMGEFAARQRLGHGHVRYVVDSRQDGTAHQRITVNREHDARVAMRTGDPGKRMADLTKWPAPGLPPVRCDQQHRCAACLQLGELGHAVAERPLDGPPQGVDDGVSCHDNRSRVHVFCEQVGPAGGGRSEVQVCEKGCEPAVDFFRIRRAGVCCAQARLQVHNRDLLVESCQRGREDSGCAALHDHAVRTLAGQQRRDAAQCAGSNSG